MTNIEKFENTFGFKPDTEFGILNCPEDHAGSQCPYYEELDGGCHCETWWNEEYKPNPRIVEILDYLRDFDWYSPYQETIDELRNLLDM